MNPGTSKQVCGGGWCLNWNLEYCIGPNLSLKLNVWIGLSWKKENIGSGRKQSDCFKMAGQI